MNKLKVKIHMTDEARRVYENGNLPMYHTGLSAGADLRAVGFDNPKGSEQEILPGESVLVRLGIHLDIPPGFEAQLRPRSSLSRKRGLIIPGSPGTIDADFRGELTVLVKNDTPFLRLLGYGDRICQLVFAPVYHAEWEPCDIEDLSLTARGNGSFGSTGV